MKRFHIKSQFLLKKDTAWHHEPYVFSWQQLARAKQCGRCPWMIGGQGAFMFPLATWPSLSILVASVLLQASLEFRSPEVSL